MQSYMQEFQKSLDWDIKGSNNEEKQSSLLWNHLLLTTEVAEIALEFRKLFTLTEKYKAEGYTEEEAFHLAKESIGEDIGKEISDCIAYLCKFAIFFERDMETDFYAKMKEVDERMKVK